MPNAFDVTALTVQIAADAQIRIIEHPEPCGPGERYMCKYIYYRGIGPPARGFDIDWYETLAARNAAPETPGAGTVLTTGKPSGKPVNINGGGIPLEGTPLPPVGSPIPGTVARGYFLDGRAPSKLPDGTPFVADKTYYARVWILQNPSL